MDSKEFKNYIMEHRRIGLDDSQIARKLGMDVGIFKDAVDYAFNIVKEEPAAKVEEKPIDIPIPRKPLKKAEVFEVPQSD